MDSEYFGNNARETAVDGRDPFCSRIHIDKSEEQYLMSTLQRTPPTSRNDDRRFASTVFRPS